MPHLTVEICSPGGRWQPHGPLLTPGVAPGFAGRSDRRAGAAAAVVAGETLLFAGNRCRCPLTELAERYGAEHGPVTDIYLPKWFAHNMPAIHAPLLVLMAYLHARNLIHPRAPLTNRARGTSPRRCP